jgi:mono/diheme cytochrome c family protein
MLFPESMHPVKTVLKATALLILVAALACGAVAWSIVRRGVSARDEPTAVERVVARSLRHLAVPRHLRDAVNPVPHSEEVLASARAHFADHCASCHGNDGKGRTKLGQGLYPKAPDMTGPGTQDLSDGELFSIIENGVRLTGMPAWGAPGPHDDAETWELVHLIRHLPRLTADELAQMEELNPRSRAAFEEEERIRKFLAGEDAGAPPAEGPHGH